MTKMIYPEDKSAAMLFGDGGAAVLLEKTDEENMLTGRVCTDGSGYRAIIAPAEILKIHTNQWCGQMEAQERSITQT